MLVAFSCSSGSSSSGSCSPGSRSSGGGSVLLPNGSRVSRLGRILATFPNIEEAQIYQPRVGEIVLRVVPGPRYCRWDEIRLVAEFRRRVGVSTRVRVKYVAFL